VILTVRTPRGTCVALADTRIARLPLAFAMERSPSDTSHKGIDVQITANSLLLVTHVAVRRAPWSGRTPIDDQTAAGIAQWCRHFEKVTYCGIAEATGSSNSNSTMSIDISNCSEAERCELFALPHAACCSNRM
jgi:hypothetical protein